MTDYMLAKCYKRAFLVALGLFFATAAWIAFGPHPQQPQPSVIEKHDTIYNDTTIYKPTPSSITQTGKTVFIPYIVERTDTLHDRDTISVPVPVEQKRYDDSLYTAWVSGYQPQLDSITLHQPTIVETITRTIVKPAPRLSIGPSVGAGVSITGTPRLGVYAGFTVQYRLWPK